MNKSCARRYFVLAWTMALASCGGGNSSPTLDVSKSPTLTSIALSPLTVSLPPLGTQQLTVTGTYSDGSTQTLPATGETFKSSNTAVATVSAAGLVTVAAGATVGETATITATDTASGDVTAAAASTVVTVTATAPTLTSIALSPLTASLAPLGTQQLTVTGTYSDGSKKTLPASGETFKSSDTAVATVSATGLVTVLAGAIAGETATITATDTASGDVTAPSASTVVTVSGSQVGPTANSVAAAVATVKSNPKCSSSSIDTAYYWEIGDATGTLISGIQADASGATLDQNGDPISAANSLWSIASGSKWVYATYVIESRGAAGILNNTDPSVPFLNFTSGYTYLGNYPLNTPCPKTGTVDDCLAGLPTTPNAADVGAFYYDSDHMEEHATLYMGLGADGILKLQTDIEAELGTDLNFAYSVPALAIGVYTTADDYSLFLRRILSGQYQMSQTLSANPVCTNSTVAGCNAIPNQSPITNASNGAEAWHYSMGHWIEDDPVVGDGSFSSAGSLGWYPWIDKKKTYYGLIARANLNAAGTGSFEGYQSAECGRLIRNAWETGVVQAGQVPTFQARRP